MDQQIQSFLELSAEQDLVPLAADARAAWLWSADGAKVLWANAAGAAFFSAHTVQDLDNLKKLEKSPARPHIARIAANGFVDRLSIERLRFYRGLRVLLLTCQCKRIVLQSGESAALIISGDKGLATTKDPATGFAKLLTSASQTVFVTENGQVSFTAGTLSGTPEDLALPEDQSALFGPLDLDGQFHDGTVLQVSPSQKVVVLENEPLADDPLGDDGLGANAQLDEDPVYEAEGKDAPLAAAVTAGAAGLAAGAATPLSPQPPDLSDDAEDRYPGSEIAADAEPSDTSAETAEAQPAEDVVDAGSSDDQAVAEWPAETTTDPDLPREAAAAPSEPVEVVLVKTVAETSISSDAHDKAAEAALFATPAEPEAEAEAEAETPSVEADPLELFEAPEGSHEAEVSETSDDNGEESGFVFQPRRRPVRFAWKMDIDQRFTFLSDEFADVLGPSATDIVGLTWAEVADSFDLDPRGSIARALDRRDTWSGKTVDWPVSGAALRVPVDMAALPAFDRNRKFEGYRGFGVCRTADALKDPDAIELSPAMAAFDESFAAEPEDAVEEFDDDTPPMTQEVAEQERAEKNAPSDAAVVNDEPFQSEADISEASAPPPQPEPEPEPEPVQPDEATGDKRADEISAASASTADLKPKQPESLAGKTFLGASAAAVVGTLARFTGRPSSAATPPTTRSAPTDTASPDKSNGSGDALQSAAANETPPEASQDEAAIREPEAEAPVHEATGDTAQSADANLPSPETATSNDTDVGPEDEGTVELTEALVKTPAGADTEGGRTPEVASQKAVVTETDTTAASPDVAREATKVAEEIGIEEPTGISGTAPLNPSEIESAVKTLAKTYNTEPKAPDLFDGSKDVDVKPETSEQNNEAADRVPETGAPDRQDSPGRDSPEHDSREIVSETALKAVTETNSVLTDNAPPADTGSQPEDEAPDPEHAAASVSDATDAVLDADQSDSPDDTAQDNEPAEIITSDPTADEREFFEETAAFEAEDQEAEAQLGQPEDTEEPPKTGQVIPLATARPRVVPVDTSGLSRPERQAFRKIAEALGARLEGDLEEFDEPDQDSEDGIEDDLPPEVPEAGPIDPSLLDRLPIGIAIVHDREVLYGNKALLKLLGYQSIAALSEAGGLEALFIDDSEDLPDEAMDGEVDETMKVRRADGGVSCVDAHMHSVPWNGGRGLMISITELPAKPAADETQVSPNFFAEVRSELSGARDQIAEMDTILETATDGVLVLDRDSRIVKANGSAEALFSASRADMIGAPFSDFLAPESHRAAEDYIDGLSRNGVASILNDGREVLGKVPTGGLIPLFLTMGRITSSKDDPKYCVVLRDITQWKTAEEELTQAKRQAENASSAKSDFLAKISHEIRTPLNAIIGFSEVMMDERFGPIGNDRYKDYLKDIRTSGSHIMSLINDLLDLSKIEAGKLDLKFTAVSTNDVINECVALMQPQANRERVIIRASLPDSVPNVVADPRSLRQIVLNLLSNAIKYNKSGGQVILSTALETNGEVALRVRDTGTGMTAKQLTAALEPFRQLHTASHGGGTGLGLPLTKALVEANRATFHIDSTPDQGTLVEITFPTQRVLAE